VALYPSNIFRKQLKRQSKENGAWIMTNATENQVLNERERRKSYMMFDPQVTDDDSIYSPEMKEMQQRIDTV
jgi:hypothetical protein